ncbi:type II toxin-antitoxin system VapC family toxin [Synechococcus elongatus]|uniref:Ribonuclease VapC n=1 Tax=Synechococcus elongatus PCC 11802 TaxID=2283154 RepID=A0AAT9JMV2_SYNEL|nr:type II toxin-antitoxin system VapC family toxin [Synechococcus elongatus]QFZ92443.1 type II toxin-antitoxin system VapC family toxin [Synechococcus elongatus PCC 11802]
MFLLDTNVISELFRPAPNPAVLAWYDQTPQRELFLSAITVAELDQGVALLPEGRRKASLREAVTALVEVDFRDRVLSFDLAAAWRYGSFVEARSCQGLSVSVNDALIAAIALSRRYVLVTRNQKDFSGVTELKLVNPFEPSV